MEITIGKLRLDVTSSRLVHPPPLDLLLFEPPLEAAIKRLEEQKLIYSWNCQTQTGQPFQRDSYKAETEFLIAPRIGWSPWGAGPFDPSALWYAAADLTAGAFRLAVREQFPSMKLNLNWNRLLEPFKNDYHVDVHVKAEYLVAIARPYGLNVGDYMYILTPKSISAASVVSGRCTGTLPDKEILAGNTWLRSDGTDDADATYRRLKDQIDREEEEAEAQRKRIKEALKGTPLILPDLPNFDEEENPEEGEEGQ